MNSEVVQPTSRFHDRIGIPLFGVPEDILHGAAAFHPRERMLHFDPPFRVAYHDVEWNSPEQRQMWDLLRQRCKESRSGNVSIYDCGQ